MKSDFTSKIQEIQEQYQKLQKKLADPKIYQDLEKLKEFSRQKAQAERVILDFEKLKKIKKEVLETEKILAEESDQDLKKLAENELAKLKIEKNNLEKFLEIAVSTDSQANFRNIILEIRAGTGGREAELFAAVLFKMYQNYALKKGFKFEILSSHKTSLGGIKEIICAIEGDNPHQFFQNESGVHRVQRIPQTEKSGRIHTSTATVAVLPEATETEVKIEPKDLKIDTFRASGPGGQHVNVTDSAVRITHLPTSLVVSCQDERSQIKNRAKAEKILRSRLFQKIQQVKSAITASQRKTQVGTGERSEKIRTYNFPQDRITDHRLGITIKHIQDIISGNLDKIVEK